MREPPFWWRQGGPAAAMLAPFAAVYGAVASHRLRRNGVSAGVPVVCIGNPTVGGAGKTPAALTVARMLAADGETPVFLTRGYGGRLAGPVRVDPLQHRAADVGDEPLLLARAHATIVARDRVARGAGGGGGGRRASSSWTTASRTRRWPRISPCSWSMAGAASATAGPFRPGRCARRSARSLIARRR